MLLKAFEKSFKHLCALALPSVCASCRSLVAHEKGIGVCPECWKKLKFWKKDEVPAPQLKNITSFDAPFLFEGEIRELIHSFKYGDREEYASLLAAFMKQTLEHFPEDTLLIPVPLHSARLLKRGFNQASLLAEKIAKNSVFKVEKFALQRTRSTKTQVGRSRLSRQKEMRSAFKANEKKVAGKIVVLIDDVLTTGSTAESCAKALLKAGAKEVHVRTICYVEVS